MKYRVVLTEDKDWFVVECPTLPGCVSQGKTRKEAIDNIKEAIEGYVKSLKMDNLPIPSSEDEEVVEVNV